MRGTAVPLPVPNGGLVANLPVHQLQPNQLSDGSNVYVDQDGLLKPRNGYNPLLPVGPSAVAGVFTITSIANGGGVATALLTGTPTGVSVGDKIVVAGNAVAQLNGTWIVSAVNLATNKVSYNTGIQGPLLGTGGTLSDAAIGTRITGGITYKDSTGSVENVCAGPSSAFAIVNGVWTNITDLAHPLTAGADQQVRFVAFSQAGVYYALFANDTNTMRAWTAGNATYSEPAAAPISRDLLVLSNRVLAFNTTESGTRFPRRVRWSAFNDYTTWPVLAFNDMLDSDDPIIAARRTGRTSAAVYGEKSIWTVQANPGGDDASAFTTEELFSAEGYSGPIGTAAVVIAEGAHYYLATDGRVYQFNGIQPQAISDPIDPVTRKILATSFGTRCHGVYVPQKRGVIFFFPIVPNADCTMAMYLSLSRGVWEPLFTFPEAISSSWGTTLVTGQTWAQNPYTWLNSPFRWQDKANATNLGVLIGSIAGQVHQFYDAFMDNGRPIPYSAISGLFTPDPSQTVLLDRAEIYLKTSTVHELIAIQFDGFTAPGQPATPLVSIADDIGGTSWIDMPIEPGPLNPNNQQSNFLRMKIFSAGSQGGFAFQGGNLYISTDPKGDYGP